LKRSRDLGVSSSSAMWKTNGRKSMYAWNRWNIKQGKDNPQPIIDEKGPREKRKEISWGKHNKAKATPQNEQTRVHADDNRERKKKKRRARSLPQSHQR